mmetsp:Transcript_23109/g.45072  ORF Transcript_23109/g.45072 Transcript_23109/m.45072 type:complete len:81 (-) Transcript_23109:561-803(-)
MVGPGPCPWFYDGSKLWAGAGGVKWEPTMFSATWKVFVVVFIQAPVYCGAVSSVSPLLVHEWMDGWMMQHPQSRFYWNNR